MEQKIREMLSAIDRQDMSAFGKFLADDARFVFGNGEAIHGRESIVSVVTSVLQSLTSIAHTAQRFWSLDGVAICEGRVLYVDGLRQKLDAPFVDVLDINAHGLITDYRVYVDASQLNRPQ
ncbi:ketosteroid isomerase-like protein [Paraburkholderia sp. BL6669N2]|uniref:nuclear transport factor 2 family protein n=1 Tax=Paraburkholderia sp. BL6669N2 TaxID=1938807 RepID=UPI000E3947D9|nr:nuclear transport factor 2 family protein [Paraburkholderia sp. BL6669N2]REG51028.1 ketosteroid isomerase-like protein [Paraburkholderia sp. BL6669N2]